MRLSEAVVTGPALKWLVNTIEVQMSSRFRWAIPFALLFGEGWWINHRPNDALSSYNEIPSREEIEDPHAYA